MTTPTSAQFDNDPPTEAEWAAMRDITRSPRCGAEYTRPGGRERGDRIVRCNRLAGHPGDHMETDTGNTWPATPIHRLPMHRLDLTGLTDDLDDPRSGIQYAVLDGGKYHAYGDQTWVADGRALDAHPDGRIVSRTITITYGPWGDPAAPPTHNRTMDALRDQLAAALATAGHCDHPGADSCSAWWQADAVLPIVAALQADRDDAVAALELAVAERDEARSQRDRAVAGVITEVSQLNRTVNSLTVERDVALRQLIGHQQREDAMRPVVDAALAEATAIREWEQAGEHRKITDDEDRRLVAAADAYLATVQTMPEPTPTSPHSPGQEPADA